MYQLRALAVKTETALVPLILGSDEPIEVYPLGGSILPFRFDEGGIRIMEDHELEEKIEKITEHIEGRGFKILFLDLVGSTISVFFSNDIKNLRLNAIMRYNEGEEDVDMTGSLGDIIRKMSTKDDEKLYFIAEEEDGTILSITRNY